MKETDLYPVIVRADRLEVGAERLEDLRTRLAITGGTRSVRAVEAVAIRIYAAQRERRKFKSTAAFHAL